MGKLKVLIIGSGGREHMLARACKSSGAYDAEVYVAPGNAGTSVDAINVAIKPDNIPGLLKFAQENTIDLTIVGPELPLVNGIVDTFRAAELRIFGPTQAAAALEGSKWFAKRLMTAAQVPTAAYREFTDFDPAWEYVQQHGAPVVIKADGLCAGKGVVVCRDLDQARDALERMLVQKEFGPAGGTVLVEDCLFGQEISVMALCDGTTHRLLVSSQDHKALGDGDTGPNTGGMGAIAPVPWADDRLMDDIDRTIIAPILKGMELEGNPFTGVLYAGLMITEQGPYVLEFNVRFGDPETQVVLPLLKSDFLSLVMACADGDLESQLVEWHDRSAVCVVLVSQGYPGKYATGQVIQLAIQSPHDFYLGAGDDLFDGALILHAGTVMDGDRCLTSGGRVLDVVGIRPTLSGAIGNAYQAADRFHFTGMQMRRDIGAKALATIKE